MNIEVLFGLPHFTNYKSMGYFSCHGNQSLDQTTQKLMQPSHEVMQHTKFDQAFPTGVEAFKFEHVCGQP